MGFYDSSSCSIPRMSPVTPDIIYLLESPRLLWSKSFYSEEVDKYIISRTSDSFRLVTRIRIPLLNYCLFVFYLAFQVRVSSL